MTAAACERNWNIVVKPQQPNSPDFNVLDLGFFNSIQSLQHKKWSSNMDTLIANVIAAFEESKRETLNNVFLSLQCAMEESLGVGGDNTYKIPHLGKKKAYLSRGASGIDHLQPRKACLVCTLSTGRLQEQYQY